MSVKGKLNAKDREGNISSEVKLMVDDAREITPEQAAAYTTTGKKRTIPKPTKKVVMTVASQTAKAAELAGRKLYIRLEDSNDHDTLLALKQTIDANQGETEVVLVLGEDAKKQIIRLPMRMNTSAESLTGLKELVGPEKIKLQ